MPERVLFIVYKYFDEDPRPKREAAALLARGIEVDVICPKRPDDADMSKDALRFFSPVMARKRGSKFRYLMEYFYFLLYAAWKGFFLSLRRKYAFAQIFVMPELLMLCCLPMKLFGVNILMDWEDPSREVFLTKFPGKRGFPFLQCIGFFERVAVWLAKAIIVPNEGFRRTFAQRGIDPKRIDIVMNGPDPRVFATPEKKPDDGSFIMLYNGTVVPRHGLDLAIEAFASVAAQIPKAKLVIIGDGENAYLEHCKALAKKTCPKDRVEFIRRIPIEEIPGRIQSASLGLVPNLRTPFTEINFPQRILEFGLLRRPLAVARLPGIEDYVSDDDVFFFNPGDSVDLGRQMLSAYANPELRQAKVLHAHETCGRLDWEAEYFNVINKWIRK